MSGNLNNIAGAMFLFEVAPGRFALRVESWSMEDPHAAGMLLQNVEREGFRIVMQGREFIIVEPVLR